MNEQSAACPPSAPLAPLAYTNRRGAVYYLHRGQTKTGKPRYFVRKTVGPGALAEMPAGFEFSESINGVVSVQQKDTTPGLIPAADVEAVRRELARHAHLRHYIVEGRRDEIIIHEPQGLLSAEGLKSMQEHFGWRTAPLEKFFEEARTKARYAPVMKFTACVDEPGEYVAYRWFYRGDGGWFHLSMGSLQKLLSSYVAAIGTDRLFDLY